MGPEPSSLPELPPPQPLPIITEEARQRLLEELALNIPEQTNNIIAGITGEAQKNSYEAVSSTTNQVFYDLITSNKGFVQLIREELEKVQPAAYVAATNSRTAGMAIILRAFDISSNFDLIRRFANLQTEDLRVARAIMRQALPSDSYNISILGKLLTMPRIPEQQVALNEILNILDSAGWYHKEYVKEGAAAMYYLMGNLWPKLYPQNQTTPSQPSSTL